jgi:hypothetical protein
MAKSGLQTEGIMMELLSRADIKPTRSTLGSLQSFVCLTKVAKRNWICPFVRNCDGCKNSTNWKIKLANWKKWESMEKNYFLLVSSPASSIL